MQATGLAFSLIITASLDSLFAALIAAKKRDIPTHRRHVIRMIGLAYGVFPFKYIWAVALTLSNVVSGTWLYSTSVFLSAITGVLVTEWAFQGQITPKDMAHDRVENLSATRMDKED